MLLNLTDLFDMSYYQYDKLFGYKFIPTINKRIIHEGGGYVIKTNTDGFRDDKNFVHEKTSKKRVLIFGDSFTAGTGVSNEFRYTDLIENNNRNIEFYNFAVPGTGTDQQFLIFDHYQDKFDYDHIILAFMAENIRRVKSRYRIYRNENGVIHYYQKPYYEYINNELVLSGVPPNKKPHTIDQIKNIDSSLIDKGARFPLINKIAVKLKMKELLLKITPYQPFPEYDNKDGIAWKLIENIIINWNNKLRNNFSILLIPPYQYVEKLSSSKNFNKRFEEIAENHGINILNPLNKLWEYGSDERRNFRFIIDSHLTPKGHKVYADIFKDFFIKTVE